MNNETATETSGKTAAATADAGDAITDVIFDFCGVLLELNYRPCLEGHFPESLIDQVCSDRDVYGFYTAEARMDAGEDFAMVIKDYEAAYGPELAAVYRYYIEHYDNALPKMIDGMESLLVDLIAAGIRVWGLTNWSAETFHFAFERFPRLKVLLKDTIVSGAEHMHKPNADIFELALNRFGLTADHCVFFDDTAANVEGADSVGIHGRRFVNAQTARADLSALGVLV
ncbi:haloacid dehalogenase superfamily, subfamily IA, variant 3 with third motif having DD or ED [Bifidobacterium bohemicum]|uniref:HAD-superfamily hydrolase n=1 Tax=Bifidobacterium bohemicum DSM 22767 TaxID=1437606 RepID=A0A086ZJK6_9BIFI|nr:HAD family phosphatase [Bifidobacterium bohemicum]KFI46706.1 HAD-superfamily hydrolase [Bifidobacterium bohemicum DSM 22767]SCB79391.1 haloacid dehalogenase superfamily, subfamily IA, variant 3 with third motif having DD or ED [Bifidobacterium bohemicum]